MANLLLSFEVVFPIFIYLLLGFVFNRLSLIDNKSAQALNSFVFGVALPFSLFMNVYSVDIEEHFDLTFILQGTGAATVAAIIGLLVGRIADKDNRRKSVISQAIFRSNFIIFGISIASTLYGQSGITTASLLIAFVVPIFNIFSIFAFEFYGESKSSVRSVVLTIAKTPIVVAAFLAFGFHLLNINIPDIVLGPLRSVGNTASPVGLIALGASFKFSDTLRYKKPLLIGIFCKLILLPLLFIPVAFLFNIKGEYLLAIFSILASPVAISSYSTAQKLGGDGALAGQFVVFSSLFSVVTLFLWIFTLSSLGLIIT